MACPSYALITMVSILTLGLSLPLLCPDLSDPSILTEHTSDNQRLRTSNGTTSVVKHLTLKSQLDWVLTIRWPVFWVDKLRYMEVWQKSGPPGIPVSRLQNSPAK